MAVYLLIAGLALIGVGLTWLFRPLATRNLSVLKSAPAPDYATAVSRFQIATAGKEGPEILTSCYSILLEHDRKTERAILFLHGLTSCPKQFEKLGNHFYEMGYNVLIPRLPLHGMADRMNGNLTSLTAEVLQTFAEECLNITRGLGDKVTIVGLSGGGVLATWLAQFSPDIEQAVIMSPSLGLYRANTLLNNLITKLMMRLPNVYNLRTAENQAVAPPYVQIKNSSHAAAQFFRLGITVFQAARKSGPACQRIVVVSNASDIIVNNRLVKRLVQLWQANSTGQVETFEFEASQKLPHDIIDPNAKVDHSALVYPVLLDIITGWET